VAPPPKKGHAQAPATGKVYSGKSAVGSGIGGGVSAPKKFTGGAGGAVKAEELKQLEDQVSELKLSNDTLDREREFYFGKLRDIEEML